MVEGNLRELMIVATAKAVFSTPHMKPIAETEQDCDGKGDRCNHCLHYSLYQCGRRAIKAEPKSQEEGCQQFLFTQTYF